MNKKVLIFAVFVIVILGVAFLWFIPKASLPTSSVSEKNGVVSEAALAVGETKLINGVQLTLNKIVNDSRCPIGVQCIQAGWVTANITLANAANQETVDIRSGTAPKAFNSFMISIIKIAPEKISTQEIKTSEYRLTFRVDVNK